MFSLRAPTQPAKPSVNVTPPTSNTNQTGSKPCSRVTWVRSIKMPFKHKRHVKSNNPYPVLHQDIDDVLAFIHLFTPCPKPNSNEACPCQLHNVKRYKQVMRWHNRLLLHMLQCGSEPTEMRYIRADNAQYLSGKFDKKGWHTFCANETSCWFDSKFCAVLHHNTSTVQYRSP